MDLETIKKDNDDNKLKITLNNDYNNNDTLR